MSDSCRKACGKLNLTLSGPALSLSRSLALPPPPPFLKGSLSCSDILAVAGKPSQQALPEALGTLQYLLYVEHIRMLI